MSYQEHEPVHFHAEHDNQHAKFSLDGKLMAGEIRSRKARERIRTWAVQHQAELMANWESMQAGGSLESIEPLRKNQP